MFYSFLFLYKTLSATQKLIIEPRILRCAAPKQKFDLPNATNIRVLCTYSVLKKEFPHLNLNT